MSVFTKEDTSSLPDKGPSLYPSMSNIEINWKWVHKLLEGLKPFNATGPNSIPAFILKAAADELAPMLARIYQTPFDAGQVPADLRDAWIVPVFKKGGKHNAANYPSPPHSFTNLYHLQITGAYHPQQCHGTFWQALHLKGSPTWLSEKVLMRITAHPYITRDCISSFQRKSTWSSRHHAARLCESIW